LIRLYNNTKEDAEKLAECFNSFDDSDSWPGSFTSGIKFTAERVMQKHNEHKYLAVYVAEMDDKIVGYCSVDYSRGDPEAYYVALLGVSPAYQGRGLGKALLRKAVDSAIEAGAKRIDLHTWGGNIKAMPLYKRVGYNWVPNTDVLMENYIPAIVNNPFLAKFFKKHDWYESLKREIKQEEDIFFEDGIMVFKYHFEGGDDTLDVLIDRYSKSIIAFDMYLDGKHFTARIKMERQKAYIGAGYVEGVVELKGFEKPEPFVSLKLGKFVKLVAQTFGIYENNVAMLKFAIAIKSSASAFDTVQIPDEKVESTVKAGILFGDIKFTLECGIIPIYVYSLNTVENFKIVQNKTSEEVSLYITNNTDFPIDGVLSLRSSDAQISPNEIKVKLNAGESLEIPVEINCNKRNLAIEILNDFHGAVGDKILSVVGDSVFIPVIGSVGVYGYQTKEAFVIGNESFRIQFLNRIPYDFIKMSLRNVVDFIYYGLNDDIGPPFAGESSEFSQKEYNVKILVDGLRAKIIFSAKSDTYNVTLHRIVEVEAGVSGFKLWHEFEGEVAKLENKETLTGAWNSSFNFTKPVFISKDGLVHFVNLDGGEDTSSKPEDYKESWIACEIPKYNLVTGIIWIHNSISTIRLNYDGISRLRNKIEIVDSSHARTKPFWYILDKSDWSRIHELYHQLVSNECYLSNSKQFINLSITNTSKISDLFALLDPDSKTLTMHAESLRVRKLDTTIKVDIPNISLRENSQVLHDLSIDKAQDAVFKIKAISPGIHFGSIGVYSDSINTIFPLSIAVYGKSEITQDVSVSNGMQVYHLNNGNLDIRLSPDYGMTLFSMKLGNTEYLFNRFPEIKPYCYDAFYFGGLRPYVHPPVWHWKKLYLEHATASWISDGPWKGIEISSTFEKMPMLSGLKMSIRYWIVPELPILKVDIEFTNPHARPLAFLGGLRMHTAVMGEVHNVYHARLFGRPINRFSAIGSLFESTEEEWIAISGKQHKHYIGMVNLSNNAHLSMMDMGDLGQETILTSNIYLKPNESCKISAITVIADGVQIFRNIWQSLKKVYIDSF